MSYVQNLRESKPVARKEHRCDMCHGAIKVGEKYVRSTNVYDGRVYDFTECGECIEDLICIEVHAYTGGWHDEGVNAEQADEWAHETAKYGKTCVAQALRWLRRNGCECEDCESRFRPGDRG